MKRSICMGLFAVGILLIALAGMAGAQGGNPLSPTGLQTPLGTAFTYQGELRTTNGPLSGTCDFQFGLWDALDSVAQVGVTQTVNGVSVVNGLFAVQFGFGGSAFSGEERWVQIAVQCGGIPGLTTLAPRQPLTPAPYALYSSRSVWSGLSGVPAGFADNVDNDTTYLAGAGLMLTASQFTVDFAGAGAATTVARSDHNHLGQNWTGSNNPLVITGTFGPPDYASLVLGNAHASGDGLRVTSTGDDGVYVGSAGAPSTTTSSSYHNGFEVAGAEGSGLWVGQADLDGVTVNSAQWYGLYVTRAGSDGVRVQTAGANGVVAYANNANYYGGRFVNNASGGVGLYTAGGDNSTPDLVLGTYGSGDDGRISSDPELTGSDILMFSNDEFHIHLDEDNNSDSAFVIYNGANVSVFSVDEAGAVTFANAAATRVKTGDYGFRSVYAVQATGNWCEDFGAAQLKNGRGTVPIEPVFAQTVNLTETYHVFLTPLGDCPLYVSGKTPTLFTVEAIGGLKCSVAFDYRIVAQPLGHERLRLETPSDKYFLFKGEGIKQGKHEITEKTGPKGRGQRGAAE